MLKTASYNKVKKEAVEELLSTKTKKISKKQMGKVAQKHELSVSALTSAYTNYLNFGCIDCRCKTKLGYKSSPKTKDLNNLFAEETYEKCERLYRFKTKELTSKEAGNLIHEFLFSSNERITDYLLKKELNPNQWYSWIREMKIHGTLLGRTVLDYKKYGKIDVRKVMIYARRSTRTNFSSVEAEAKAQKHAWSKGLSTIQFKQLKRATHVLYMYL